MSPKYAINSGETLETLKRLTSCSVDGVCILMRHSERNYHENASMEPFMGLTENGKTAAADLGAALPPDTELSLFSSHFGRCIETAYLIDKGFTTQNRVSLSNPVLSTDLSPFYIRHIEKAITMVEEMSPDRFLRTWFNREIPEDTMADPKEAAMRITAFLKSRLDRPEHKHSSVCICVTHDWNIFPVKEHLMGLAHEENGPVGYLDAVFLFKRENRYFITSRQQEPIEVTLAVRDRIN
ncbi:MAG: histidine phosphatase family protein [Desulfobacteraceae bacterium]